MHPQLADLVRQLDDNGARLHRLAAQLSPPDAVRRRTARRWSPAECVEHLNLTSRAFLPPIDRGLADARRLGGPARGRYRHNALGWLLAKIVGPQPRIGRVRLGRVRTKPPFEPAASPDFAAVVAEFDRLQREVAARVRAADGLPIDRVRIPSPFDPRVGYNLYSAFVLIPRHQARHLIQAEDQIV
jgi:hypothetical protein